MTSRPSFRNATTGLLVSMLLTFFPAFAPTAQAASGGDGVCQTIAFAGGDGTSGNPFQVATVEQLKELGDCDRTSNYYVLTANLDLGGEANPWTPLAGEEDNSSYFYGFQGKLDGGGHAISNLYVKPQEVGGLFGYINEGASISNLEITNATVSGEIAGVLAGSIRDNVALSNLTLSGTVIAMDQSMSQTVYAGGVSGQLAFLITNTAVISTVSNVTFIGTVMDRSGVSFYGGGLFGRVGNNSNTVLKDVRIVSSSAHVRIVALRDGTIGGLAAFAHNARIWKSFADVQIETYGASAIGGAVGWAESVEIDQVAIQGAVLASSGSSTIGGVSYNLRDDNDQAAFIEPKIKNSIVQMSVQNLASGSRLGGLVGAINNGDLQNNVVMVDAKGFATGYASAIAGTLTSITGTSITFTNNLFDNTNTAFSGHVNVSNRAANEVLGVSASSVSQTTTLTNSSFDTASIWDVQGVPVLREVPKSSTGFSPKGLLARDGQSLEVFVGTPISSSASLNLSDFNLTVDNQARALTTVQVSAGNPRYLLFSVSSAVDSLEELQLSYQAGPSTIPLTNYSSGTNLSAFSLNPVNAVLVSAPQPTSGTLTPTEVESFNRTLMTFDGANLSEASIQIKRLNVGGFGSVEVESATATQVQFWAPTQTFSTSNRVFQVRIATRGGVVLLTDTYTYLGSPSISSVTPTFGGSGTLVDIGGTNLSTATTVSFGTTHVAVSSATSTTISVVAPAGTVGQTVNITAAGPGWTSTLTSRFQFTASPSLSGISSTSGTTAGGETITLTGTTFSGLIAVTFGAQQATIVSSTSTQIVVTTPAQSAGVVDVSVRAGGGTSTLAGVFTYVAPPTPNPTPPQSGGNSGSGDASIPTPSTPEILIFSTREIPSSGGEVTATGRRLAGVSALSLGGIKVTIVSNTDTSVTFTTGDMPIGVWDLRLVGSNGTLVFQQAIEVVEASAIVAESTGELLGYTWTLKFIGNSRSLHSAQREHLASKLDDYSTAETIICWGYTTAANPNAWAIAHATQRAQAACDLAIANNSEAKTVVRLRYGVSKNWAMRSALQFWR